MASRFIFITGGVVSSLGKGLASAALGALLQARGYRVRVRKLDPYLNVDPGTMSPFEHGEVYVTDDGAEGGIDLNIKMSTSGVRIGVFASSLNRCVESENGALCAWKTTSNV